MSMIIPDIEEFVPEGHAYRKLLGSLNFNELSKPLEKLYSKLGQASYPISSGLRSLFLQFWNDFSDREMEEYLKYNLAAKYFCGFGLKETTPTSSYFSKLRQRIGAEEIAKLFDRVNESLLKAGLISGTFTFVDASSIHSQVNLWAARDKAIEDEENDEKDDEGKPTMNNKNVSNYSSDKDAKYGCKGKDKIWYGYKRHISLDMKHGFIRKSHVTPANVPDSKGLKNTCPENSMVFADKAYCGEEAQQIMKDKNCHSGAILKNNMKNKNKDKDKWLTKVRMPFEGVFSKIPKVTRLRSTVKVQFQATMQALVHNFKILLTLPSVPIEIVPI